MKPNSDARQSRMEAKERVRHRKPGTPPRDARFSAASRSGPVAVPAFRPYLSETPKKGSPHDQGRTDRLGTGQRLAHDRRAPEPDKAERTKGAHRAPRAQGDGRQSGSAQACREMGKNGRRKLRQDRAGARRRPAPRPRLREGAEHHHADAGKPRPDGVCPDGRTLSRQGVSSRVTSAIQSRYSADPPTMGMTDSSGNSYRCSRLTRASTEAS